MVPPGGGVSWEKGKKSNFRTTDGGKYGSQGAGRAGLLLESISPFDDSPPFACPTAEDAAPDGAAAGEASAGSFLAAGAGDAAAGAGDAVAAGGSFFTPLADEDSGLDAAASGGTGGFRDEWGQKHAANQGDGGRGDASPAKSDSRPRCFEAAPVNGSPMPLHAGKPQSVIGQKMRASEPRAVQRKNPPARTRRKARQKRREF